MTTDPDGVNESLRRRFEESRRQGDTTALDRFLPAPDSPQYLPTLEELISIQLELEWRQWGAREAAGPSSSPPAPLERYLDRFPELRDPEVLARLVVEEYRVRHQHGDRPAPESYGNRFGDLESSGVDILSTLQRDPALSAVTRRREEMEQEAAQDKEIKGRRLGRYELIEEIGRGSFARVYRASDPALQRPVAVKVLRGEFAGDARMAARAYHEARSAAQLRHPGIVTVYEVGEEDGSPYIVTELVDGPSLEELLTERSPEPRQAAEWLIRIADALDYAHQFGVVHRDVKPANVLMTAAHEPKVSDFGLAAGAEASLTLAGDLVGTPAYMSPEQARGDSKADARSDVYGLGVVLYRMLCGRVPFEGGWQSVIRKVIEEDPVRPRRLATDVPIDLETICLKAMAKEPARRYASAAQLAEDLRRFLAHEPILARRQGPRERLVLWGRRNPALAATIAVAAILILLVAATGLRGVLNERDRFRHERDVAQANLYRALVGEARAQAQARGTEWWWLAMDNVRKAAALEVADRGELRALAMELQGVRAPCFRLAREWTGHEAAVLAATVGPRGRLAATGAADGTIELRELADGKSLARVQGHEDAVTALAFHPRAPLLASTSRDGTLRFWSVERGINPEATLRLDAGELNGLALDTDDARLAVACGDGRVALLEVWSGDATVRFLTGHTAAVVDVSFSADGRSLASCSEDLSARVWDLPGGEALEVIDVVDPPSAVSLAGGFLFHASPAQYGFMRHKLGDPAAILRMGRVHDAAVSRIVGHGQWLFTASFDGSVKAWTSSGHPNLRMPEVAVAEGGFARVRGLGVGPQGRRLLTGYEDGAVRLWEFAQPPNRAFVHTQHSVAFLGDRVLVNESSTLRFSEGMSWEARGYRPPGVTALAVHPGGERIALGSRDGTLAVADRDGRIVWRRREHAKEITCLASGSRGRWWASGSDEGDVMLWDWQTETPVAELAAGVGEIRRLSWNRDDRILLVGGAEGALLWEPLKQEPPLRLPVVPHDGQALFAGGRVVVGTARGAIEIFNPETGARTDVLEAHTAPVVGMAYAPEAELFVTSAADRAIHVWQARTWSRTLSLAPADFAPTWLAPDPTARYLLAGGTGFATVWDLQSGLPLAWLFTTSSIACGAYLPDGRSALLGVPGGSVLSLSIDEMEERYARATAGARDPTPDSVRLHSFEELVRGGHSAHVWGVAASPDGRWIATCAHDGTVKLWETGERIRLAWSRDGHADAAWSVGFSPDSNRLVSTSVDVKVWDVHSGEATLTLVDGEELVTSAAFFHDRPWLATSSLDGAIRIWNLEDGSLVGELYRWDLPVHQLAVDPASRWLAAAAHEGHVAVWDLENLAVPAPPDHELRTTGSPVWTVAFRGDGARLASGDEAGAIVLWDVGGWKEVVRLKGDCPLLRSIAFSHDGGLLAGGSIDLAIVWDLDGVAQTLEDLGLAQP